MNQRIMFGFLIFYTLFSDVSADTQSCVFESEKSKVLVWVNQEPIYKDEVEAGFKKPSFNKGDEWKKEEKLNRLIQSRLLKQMFKIEGIISDPQKVEKELEILKAAPPSAECSCCTYSSLDAFMEAYGYDFRELQEEIANTLGFTEFAGRQWKKKYSGDEEKKLLEVNKKDFEAKYFKVSHIFFNVFQKPEYNLEPEKVWARASDSARHAWMRVENGESFEVLARNMSEDKMTALKGGLLGCIDPMKYGKEFASVLKDLKIGKYAMAESMYGVHVLRRECMTDEDILDCLKKIFERKLWNRVIPHLWQEAKIDRVKVK